MQLFEPVLVKGCADVGGEIKKLSQLYAIEEHLISFDILQISTFYRGEKKKDFSLLEPDERDKILQDDAEYNKNDFELKQVCDVLIRSIKDGDLAPFVALEIDEDNYALTLELKAGLEIKDDESFYSELYAHITRQKIINHVIIRLFDKAIKPEIESLKELLAKLDIKGKLESSQKLLLAKSTGYVPTSAGSFQFLLQEAWNSTNDTSIDFASYAAKSGELVGISLKPREGVSGRNLIGEYTHAKAADSSAESKLRCKEGEFKIEEKEESVEYYASIDGYVSVADGELKMQSNFALAEVSQRSGGSLLGGDKKGFVVEVTCTDNNQDAIGANAILEAAEVKVYGSIGENAKIVAQKAQINGLTHQSASVKADEIEIEMHKGSAIGKKVVVKNLEVGSVEGEEVTIEEAMGGSIGARDLTINNLHANVNIAISHALNIKNISDGKNRVIITSRASPEAKAKVAELDSKTQEHIKAMNILLNALNRDLARVRKAKPVVDKIKDIMEENKKNNKPNGKDITDSMVQYVTLLRRTKYLKERLVALQKDSKALSATLEALDKETLEAKIITNSAWQKDNEIVYESFYPESRDTIILSEGEKCAISIDAQTRNIKRDEADKDE